MGWAFWLQYGMGLEPCPLCLFQRVAVIAIGIVFLVGLSTTRGALAPSVYAGSGRAVAGIGVAFATRHVWIQALPDRSGTGVRHGHLYMLETMPLLRRGAKRLRAAAANAPTRRWVFLNLSIAGWTFVFFIAVAIYALALIRRD